MKSSNRGWWTGLSLAGLLVSGPAHAADDDTLTADRVGKIQFEQQQAEDKVKEKFGGKKMSEMSDDERKDFSDQTHDAKEKVLEDNGTNDKAFQRYTAHMSRDDRETARDAAKKSERDEIRREVKNESTPGTEAKVVPFDSADQPAAAAAAPQPPTTGKTPPPAAPTRTKKTSRHRKQPPPTDS
jgi:hypothetical protein